MRCVYPLGSTGWLVSLALWGCLELPTFSEATDTVAPGEDTSVAQDSTVSVDTAVAEDTATTDTVAPGEDTAVAQDSTVSVDTAVAEDTAAAQDTAVAEDTAVAQDSAATEDTDGGHDADVGEVDAAATCTPPCANGGLCVALDACDCAGTGFGGATCEVPTCGDVVCPEVTGYVGACNGASRCEYTRAEADAPWHADDVWIYVPPGQFPMGAPESEADSEESERPVREVSIGAGFLIARHPVTVRTYEACEAEERCTAPSTDDFAGALPPTVPWGLNRSDNGRARHPQNGITWFQAADICGWLGARRPTEAEWEYAAKGSAHRRFPWGDTPEPVCTVHAIYRDGGSGCGAGGAQVQMGTWEVGANQRTAGASAVGALDMAGSLWEWTEDGWCEDTTDAPVDGSAADGCGAIAYRTVKGGAFTSFKDGIRAARRIGGTPSRRSAIQGVRCVRSLP